jgi:hypothetical protein
MADQESELEKIRGQLNAIELRLKRLEMSIAGSPVMTNEPGNDVGEVSENETAVIPTEGEESGLESQIGRFGLAWMGNIILLVGITFLTQYMMNLNHQLAAVVLGYLAATSLFLVSGYLKRTNPHLSFIFRMNSLAIMFFITLRLHFFSSAPLITGKTLAVILLMLIIAVQAYLAIRDRSQAFAALAVLFALSAALISDSTIFTPLLIIMTGAGAVYWMKFYGWRSLLLTCIVLTYMSYFFWVLGDPLLGHPVKLISQKYLGVICLFALGAMYSMIMYFRNNDASSDGYLAGVAITNGILFTLLLMFVSVSYFSSSYVVLFTSITVCCLAYSILLRSRSSWNFASAFYALYGFMAMSIALYGLVGFPVVYLLLALQSLVVVSMALWFKNRLIVIMNSLLFLTILLTYLFLSNPNDGVNFSFAISALISARVINWKKSRLQIKTDLIRNLYMIEGFVMVLIALFHSIPKHLITLSWTMAALLYFLLSIFLRNVKYRYMALGTVICAAIYLFIIDLASIELIYRVLALLFLAMISIGISIYYTSRIKRTGN